jgi:protein TonB
MVLSSFEMNLTNSDFNAEKVNDGSYFEVAVPDLLKRHESTYVPPPPPPPPPSADKQGTQIIEKETVPEKIAVVIDSENEMVPDEIFMVVEVMPQFPGSEKALMEFIYQNVSYPEKAKEKSIQGRVIIRFAVMADGNVSNISVLKGVDPELDNEALRVIGLLPQWKPGLQGGKPVNVWYSVPVTFTLN